MEIASTLAAMGPRFTGTDNDARASDYLVQQLAAAGLDAQPQAYHFTGWENIESPSLRTLAPLQINIPCTTMVRSGAGTARGHLRPAGRRSVVGVFEWESFEIVGRRGEVAGLIICREDGPAIPQCLDESAAIPTVIVGSDWLRDVGPTAPDAIEVELSTSCREIADCTSYNVIGTLPDAATATAEILVCAHYDSMYGSPGANDNASGAEVVVALAQRGVDLPADVTLRFVIFSGEEWIQLGSKAYLAMRRRAGDLEKIQLVLNIDMVGKGDYLWPSVTDATEPIFQQAVRQVLPAAKVTYHNPPMKGDHYPFHAAGIPTIMLLWWPDHVYHTKDDTVELLNEAMLQQSTALAQRLIQDAAHRLTRLGRLGGRCGQP